MGKARVSGIL
jgi:hypothetical protein